MLLHDPKETSDLMKIQDAIVLITGANRGIGNSTVEDQTLRRSA
jgi:short-subunit dehydrogenase